MWTLLQTRTMSNGVAKPSHFVFSITFNGVVSTMRLYPDSEQGVLGDRQMIATTCLKITVFDTAGGATVFLPV